MTTRFTLSAFLIWSTVIPVWLYVTLTVGSAPGMVPPFGYILVPLLLVGISAALHRLRRKSSNGWALSCLNAPILAFVALAAVAWSARECSGYPLRDLPRGRLPE